MFHYQVADPHETVPHIHEASSVRVAVAQVKFNLKMLVQTARARPGQVLAAAVVAARPHVRDQDKF